MTVMMWSGDSAILYNDNNNNDKYSNNIMIKVVIK